jgi:Family of unknown function (DUF5808)
MSTPKSKRGKFLGMPYDWRRPTRRRARNRAWNKDDPRILVPKAYGWGYSINFAALLRRPRRPRRAGRHAA